MRHASVDDVGERDAAVDRLQARRQLGPHAAGDRSQRRLDLVGAGLGDDAGRVVRVAQPAGHVGQEHDLVGAERRGHRAGGLVGIDVVGVAVAVGADGGDHRDVVLGDMVEDVDVDALDPADEADVLAGRRRLARGAEQQPVVAAQADRRLAVAVSRSTMSLLTLPTRTIFATSTVAASETRRPSTNCTGRSSRSM